MILQICINIILESCAFSTWSWKHNCAYIKPIDADKDFYLDIFFACVYRGLGKCFFGAIYRANRLSALQLHRGVAFLTACSSWSPIAMHFSLCMYCTECKIGTNFHSYCPHLGTLFFFFWPFPLGSMWGTNSGRYTDGFSLRSRQRSVSGLMEKNASVLHWKLMHCERAFIGLCNVASKQTVSSL